MRLSFLAVSDLNYDMIYFSTDKKTSVLELNYIELDSHPVNFERFLLILNMVACEKRLKLLGGYLSNAS